MHIEGVGDPVPVLQYSEVQKSDIREGICCWKGCQKGKNIKALDVKV